MSLSDFQKHVMLDTLDGRFISLHTADPGTTGAAELAGGGYGRLLETLGAAAAGSKTTASELLFTNLPGAAISHFGVWTAVSGGIFLWGGALDAVENVPVGDSFRFPSAQLTFFVS